MIINLKQDEIVAGLKSYIAQQGINLLGKDVTIKFTAGRKDSGLTAEVTIEDAYVRESVIDLAPSGPIHRTPEKEVVVNTEVVPEPVPAEAADVQSAPIKTSSLFG